MAYQGRKVFEAGDVLTASDLNSTVDQTIMVFDDSTARDTAIPTPVEGMVAYLKSDNSVLKYDGSAWVSVALDINLDADRAVITNAGGDLVVSAVTASELGFLDGVTSNVQTQLDGKQDDVITTEGDLIIGDGSGDAVRLPVGAADTVLTSDGTTVSFAAAGGGGTVAYTTSAFGGTFNVAIEQGVYSVDLLGATSVINNDGLNIISSTRAVNFEAPVSTLTYTDRSTVLLNTLFNYSAARTWIGQSQVAFANGVHAICYIDRDASDVYYVNVLYSNDAFTTVLGPILVSTQSAFFFNPGIVAANNIFFILGLAFENDSYMRSSSDAINWTERTVPATRLKKVAFGNGVYVVVGRGGTAFSSNLSSWSSASQGPTSTNGLIFDGSQFISVQGTTLYKSTNGSAWTESTVPLSADQIAYDDVDGRYVVAGGTAVAYSDDAITWTLGVSGVGSRIIRQLSYGDGYFYMGTQDSGKLFWSKNGETFLNKQFNNPTFRSPAFNTLVDTISFAGQKFYGSENENYTEFTLPGGPDQHLILAKANKEILS